MLFQLTQQLLQKAFSAIENKDLEILKECLSKGLNVNESEYKEGNTILIHAIVQNNKEISQFLIDAGAHINKHNYCGDAPLHVGLNKDVSIDLIEFLIKQGADVNQPSNTMFPLHIAIEQNNFPAVKLLIEKGAKVNSRSGRWDSLDHAIKKEAEDILAYLLAHGAEVNQKNIIDGIPLHFALNNYYFGIAKILIVHGAPIETRDQDGRTPLHLASLFNCTEIAQMLLERKANVNVQDTWGNTPLTLAVSGNERFDMVKLLLSYGANPNILNQECLDALMNFGNASDYDFETFKILVEYGADIFHITSEDQLSLLHVLYHPMSKEMQDQIIEIIQFLLKKGLGINRQSDLGTPLIISAYWGQEKITAFLLQQGADISLCNAKGDTALHSVMYNDQGKAVIETLLNHGVTVNAQNNKGNTALHILFERHYHQDSLLDILFIMRKHGANFLLKNNDGLTPFLMTSASNDVQLANLLLEQFGADINDTDSEGNTALHSAIQKGHFEMMSFLLNKGITINAINHEGESALDYALKAEDAKTIVFLKDSGAKSFKPAEVYVEQKEI